MTEAHTDQEAFSLTEIPFEALTRLGALFREGARKYGRGNWRHGTQDPAFQLERANHALKHLLIYIHLLETGEYLGESPQEHRDDDLAKCMWFCATQMELERLERHKESPDV